MAYKITITYAGLTQDPSQIIAPVCRLYRPDNSYIDTVAYKEGVPGEHGYGPSVYATNVDGMGSIVKMEPFATTSIPFPVPLAQFKLAVVGKNNTVTFTVDDYKEAFYYMEMGEALKDQGFTVEVVDEDQETPAEELSVTGVKVVDGDDGFTEVVSPKVGQKLQAHILLSDGSDIGVYPVDPKATYKWIKKDDTPLGTEGSYIVGVNADDVIEVTVTYEGATGEATWSGTVIAAE